MNSTTNPTATAVPLPLATASVEEIRRDHQAYEVLHWAFVVAPFVAGLDKFFMLLTDWTKYLAPAFANIAGAQTFMYAVGAIEMVAGIGMMFKPRLFAPIVALWLCGIIVNLFMLGGFYDVALRDLGLLLGALALWRLSQHFDQRKPTSHSLPLH